MDIGKAEGRVLELVGQSMVKPLRVAMALKIQCELPVDGNFFSRDSRSDVFSMGQPKRASWSFISMSPN
jgi:hypothetical protein